MLLIGVLSLLLEPGLVRGFAILALTVAFLAFQQPAISPVTWLMLSEIFPMHIRGFALGVSGCMLRLVNFLVGLSFLQLVAWFSISTTFFLLFTLELVAFVFVHRYLPETCSHSLESLQRYFQQHGR